MSELLVKVVPNIQPNHDGVWYEWEGNKKPTFRTVPRPGYHIVAIIHRANAVDIRTVGAIGGRS